MKIVVHLHSPISITGFGGPTSDEIDGEQLGWNVETLEIVRKDTTILYPREKVITIEIDINAHETIEQGPMAITNHTNNAIKVVMTVGGPKRTQLDIKPL